MHSHSGPGNQYHPEGRVPMHSTPTAPLFSHHLCGARPLHPDSASISHLQRRARARAPARIAAAAADRSALPPLRERRRRQRRRRGRRRRRRGGWPAERRAKRGRAERGRARHGVAARRALERLPRRRGGGVRFRGGPVVVPRALPLQRLLPRGAARRRQRRAGSRGTARSLAPSRKLTD